MSNKPTQRKKVKRRLNKLGKQVVGGTIAFFVALVLLFAYAKNKDVKQLTELGYSKESITLIKDMGLSKMLKNDIKYSKLLEQKILDKTFNKDYIEYYSALETFDEEIEALVESLLKKGYSDDELIKLLKANDLSELYKLLVYDKIGDVDTYLKRKSGTDTTELLNPYENTVILTKWSLDMLVNKKSLMSKDLEPSELREIDKNCAFKTTILQTEAATAFESMCKQAKADGVNFASTYGYRSYGEQKDLYDNYASENTVEDADRVIARPGSSEHQTGLAVDLASMRNTSGQAFENTNEYTWLSNNAYRYGFIERYTADNEDVTGFSAEPYHWRYVGVDLATKLKESGLSYDEYYQMFIGNIEAGESLTNTNK